VRVALPGVSDPTIRLTLEQFKQRGKVMLGVEAGPRPGQGPGLPNDQQYPSIPSEPDLKPREQKNSKPTGTWAPHVPDTVAKSPPAHPSVVGTGCLDRSLAMRSRLRRRPG
jgi:hypothetical protein